MFVRIDDEDFDARMDALCALQKPPSNRNALGASIIREAVAAFEANGDPFLWQKMGAPDSETPAA